MPQPPEINVEPADKSAEEVRKSGEVMPYTTLFRKDARLDEVLGMAVAARLETQKDQPLHVLSVGSSFGAEADSALAYLVKEAGIGKVHITGIDTNPAAVESAKHGRYRSNLSYRPEMAAEIAKNLEVYNLNATPDPDNGGEYLVDASNLRAGHEVQFGVADIGKEAIDAPKSDVILCNNVLFHLTPQAAEELVMGMANQLAAGGIMSFGANPKQVHMESNAHEGKDYPEWRREMAIKLAEQGIEPVLYDTTRKAPFVFKRVRPQTQPLEDRLAS